MTDDELAELLAIARAHGAGRPEVRIRTDPDRVAKLDDDGTLGIAVYVADFPGSPNTRTILATRDQACALADAGAILIGPHPSTLA